MKELNKKENVIMDAIESKEGQGEKQEEIITPFKELSFYLINSKIKEEDEYFSFKKQGYFITDSLVIDTARTIQILDNRIFVDKIDMDYYVYRISEFIAKNDTIISVKLDKEGHYITIIDERKDHWFDFYSKYSPRSVIIKRKKDNIWELFYNDEKQGYQFIMDKDVETSGYPILFYKEAL